MSQPTQRLHLLGPIYNFVREPGQTPLDGAHQAGLTFVAMDARAYADFSGGRPTGEWVVARQIQADLPELEPWPKTGWRFQDQAGAREAYQAMRNHVLSHLPGVTAEEDRGPERRLNNPASAWGERFVLDGEEVLYLSCDSATQARLLEMLTDRLKSFETRGTTPQRYASYNSQTAPHLLAVAVGSSGVAEHLVVAFTPANEQSLITAGLPGSTRASDLKLFTLDVPSGILVLAWGRVDGVAAFAQTQGQDPAAVLHQLLGQNLAAPLPTPFDSAAPGPLAWGIRLQPGRYRCALRFLETPEGISAMALSHEQAAPLWSDMAAAPKPVVIDAAQATQAAHAAQQQMAAGQGGDHDPVVFPGQPLARLSDWVRLMKGMQGGDMQRALSRAGLDMMSYGAVAQAWGTKLASDATLTAKFAAMMAAP